MDPERGKQRLCWNCFPKLIVNVFYHRKKRNYFECSLHNEIMIFSQKNSLFFVIKYEAFNF